MASPARCPDAAAIRALVDARGRLALRVTPNARKTGIEIGTDSEGRQALTVRVAAPPEGGRANDAVIRLLAESLGLRRSALSLVQGHTARQKVVEIEGWEREWR